MIKISGNFSRRRRSKALLIGFLACFFGHQAKSKDRISDVSPAGDRFSWTQERKLTWSDFKGPVVTHDEESAAATCCSIGFSVQADTTGRPGLTVYNTFYIGRSWVKDDARMESILAHEQGHFDLCEVYTRKLRERLSGVNLASPGVKDELLRIYAALNDEYEERQQAYEHETTHGTNLRQQRRWEEMITAELGDIAIAGPNANAGTGTAAASL